MGTEPSILGLKREGGPNITNMIKLSLPHRGNQLEPEQARNGANHVCQCREQQQISQSDSGTPYGLVVAVSLIHRYQNHVCPEPHGQL